MLVPRRALLEPERAAPGQVVSPSRSIVFPEAADRPSEPEQLSFDVNLQEPPELPSPEARFYVLRFYAVGHEEKDAEGDAPRVAQFLWRRAEKRHVVVAGNGTRGLGAVLLVLRRVTMHPKDEPHMRMRIKAQGLLFGSGAPLVMVDPSCDYQEVLRLTIENIDLRVSDAFMNALQVARESMKRIVDDFANQWEKIPPPTVPATSGMRLKQYTAIAGRLPAATFALLGLLEPPKNLAKRFPWAVGVTAESHGWSFEDVYEEINDLYENGPAQDERAAKQAKALSLLFASFSIMGVSNDYVGDLKFNGRPGERFQCPVGEDLGEGDCEDVAKEIQRIGIAVQQCVAVQKFECWETREAHVLASMVREYTFLMCTGVATKPRMQKIRAGDVGDNPDDYICHVFTVAVPNSFPVRMTGGDFQGTPLTDFLDQQGGFALEGTNFTSTQLSELSHYYQGHPGAIREAAVGKWRELAMCKRALPEELKPLCRELAGIPTIKPAESLSAYSTFYRYVTGAWMVSGLADEIDWMVIKKDSNTYGVTMEDFIKGQNTEMRPIYPWHEGLDQRAFFMLQFNPPLLSLPKDPPEPEETEPLRKLKKIVEESRRRPQPKLPKRPLWRPFMEIRIQHVREITRARVTAIRRLARRNWYIRFRPAMLRPEIGVCCIQMIPPQGVKGIVLKSDVQAFAKALP